MADQRRQLGWLDANVFVHPLFDNDPHKARCEKILQSLLDGSAEGWVDPVTVHELTYALPRALPQAFATRRDVADYLIGFLVLDTVLCDDKDALLDALQLWVEHSARFGDCRLLALARSRGMAICTVNARDFPGVEITA